jgi:hypothetical protein
MFVDFEKLDVDEPALDFGDEPEAPVTVTATGSGSGLTSLLSGHFRANRSHPGSATIR